MNVISENLYKKVTNTIPQSEWSKIVANREKKSVESQGEYIELKISLNPDQRNEAKILQKALNDRYIPYHIVVGTTNQIEFLPLKLIINTENIIELDLFSHGKRDYYDTLGLLCFDKVPLHVIVEYSKIIGADY